MFFNLWNNLVKISQYISPTTITADKIANGLWSFIAFDGCWLYRDPVLFRGVVFIAVFVFVATDLYIFLSTRVAIKTTHQHK